jgi:UDP-N-acetylglucosamine 2-epimerase (non-hydrolysing)/GDP/UDP-N,N'-diacetylbacillosamine 2-epimerase (hydrolysing)
MKRKIAIMTGSRADYGILYPVIKAIKKHPGLEPVLLVTGAHLARSYGYTFRGIKKDKFKIGATVNMRLNQGDSLADMAESFGYCLIGMARALKRIKPDIVVVLGDRGETLATAIAAAHLYIPIAHIHGGDTDYGSNIDESIRPAITKFSHLHFPATKESANRIIRLGEEPWRVHVVGSPSLDAISSRKLLSRKELFRRLRFDPAKPLILTLQHSLMMEKDQAAFQMEEIMAALRKIKTQTVIIYPNADAGGKMMIKVIKKYQKQKLPLLRVFKTLPRQEYLSVLKHAKVMLGNSSSGTIEAPSFKLPVVNPGLRESGRQMSTNKIFVGHDRNDIYQGLRRAMFDKNFINKVKHCKNLYGDGRASGRIAAILSQVKLGRKLVYKVLL